jgi:hypothetical protein
MEPESRGLIYWVDDVEISLHRKVDYKGLRY